MIKIGCSIYTGLTEYSRENNLAYLSKVKKMGYQLIFSSAHINEATLNLDEIEELVNLASELDIKVTMDVSKRMFDHFKIPLKLYALRLDYGFTKEDIVELSKKGPWKVELNASTITKEYFEELIAMGLNLENVRTSFNFYPKLYTGHDIEFVREKVQYFKKYHLSTLVFLPSHQSFRPPMYEGLPTVEAHRKMSFDLMIEEIKALGVDEIAFGDAYIPDDELEVLCKHQTEQLMIPTILYKNYESLEGIYTIRTDYNQLMLRLSSSRGINDIPPFNTVERHPFDLTIDNRKFLRYRGEINIILTQLPLDERVNVIGKVELTNLMIQALKQGQKFSFLIKEDKNS